ncbi:DUF2911 domain-containing protein [Maribacter sp. MAR_2009_72]|uniref:DUF2911 domain-containing protein n=1 Tax=Maribacter sp. MAR_2009_72 TaxID=1250050 RepID=UPI001199D3F3|nr:DUF2911 domain-containing protein [Maribacter sp. MAR_2009_72]TVZ15065.1 Protein of unknown function (DUF2911) [Maribacter sp. MAR_2009_72]
MKFTWFVLLLTTVSLCKAQINHPKISPFSTLVQEVGFTEIKVEYSRPAARGRHLFGIAPNGESGLVPFGRIWRVGANASTKITFNKAVYINNTKLEKGTYALYAFPETDKWQIVFHKNINHWGDGRNAYNEKEDALRLPIVPEKTMDFQESFQIAFDAIDHNGLQMTWHWGNTKLVIPIAVDTKRHMQDQIDLALKELPNAQTYYEIARYYQEQGLETELALEYVDNAITLGGGTYFYYRVKSLILADLEQYQEAISYAEASMELAQQLNKDEFVRLNKANIKDWESKK